MNQSLFGKPSTTRSSGSTINTGGIPVNASVEIPIVASVDRWHCEYQSSRRLEYYLRQDYNRFYTIHISSYPKKRAHPTNKGSRCLSTWMDIILFPNFVRLSVDGLFAFSLWMCSRSLWHRMSSNWASYWQIKRLYIANMFNFVSFT